MTDVWMIAAALIGAAIVVLIAYIVLVGVIELIAEWRRR